MEMSVVFTKKSFLKKFSIFLLSVMFISCKMPVIIATRQKRHDVCCKTNVATSKLMPAMIIYQFNLFSNLMLLAVILLQQYYV